jgi:hypothetical protein
MEKEHITLIVYYGGKSHQYTSGTFTQEEINWIGEHIHVIKTAIELVEKATEEIDFINIRVLKSIAYKAKGIKSEGGQDE